MRLLSLVAVVVFASASYACDALLLQQAYQQQAFVQQQYAVPVQQFAVHQHYVQPVQQPVFRQRVRIRQQFKGHGGGVLLQRQGRGQVLRQRTVIRPERSGIGRLLFGR